MLERRLVATRHDTAGRAAIESCAVDAAASPVALDAAVGSGVAGELFDARSVHGDGRGNVLERRVAATWRDATERAAVESGAVGSTAIIAGGTIDSGATVDAAASGWQQHVSDAQSIRGDGRRHLLERRLAAAWNDTAELDSGSAAASVCAGASVRGAGSDTADAASEQCQMRGLRSVRRHGWRHVLERWLAAAGGRSARRSAIRTSAGALSIAAGGARELRRAESICDASEHERHLRERRLDSDSSRVALHPRRTSVGTE